MANNISQEASIQWLMLKNAKHSLQKRKITERKG